MYGEWHKNIHKIKNNYRVCLLGVETQNSRKSSVFQN